MRASRCPRLPRESPALLPNLMNTPPRSASPVALRAVSALGTVFALLAAVVIQVSSALAASAPATAPTGTIEGRVFNARSDTLVENARLSLDRDAVVTFSDADGNFRLAPVPVGTVTVRVFFTGLAPQTFQVAVAAGQRVQQDITLLPLTRDSVNAAADKVVKLDQFVVGESREIGRASCRERV